MSSVDVIVPCYRYGHFLRQCVQSVLTQTGPAVRVLIIDDASPDNTAEVAADLVREDSRVAFTRHAANKGHIATYNEGLDWASAPYLLLLSADDYLLPGALSRSVDVMDHHPEVGFVFGNVIQLHENGSTEQIRAFANPPDNAARRILTGWEFIEFSGAVNIVRTPTAVVRTQLQKQLGGYRPELPHSGDMEMWLRLAAHASVGFVDASQAVYRRHNGNMSIGYMTSNSLPDVRQRKAALDCFFQNSNAAFSDAPRLRRKIFYSLACQAVGLASAAFNEREFAISERLSEFALAVCPEIKRSWPWRKVAFKRRVGIRAWRGLQAASSILRPRRRATMTRRSLRSNALKALALRAQRLNIRMPELIRGPLRSVLVRLTANETAQLGIEDWSKPLIAGRSLTIDSNAAVGRVSETDIAPPAAMHSRMTAPPPGRVGSRQQPANSSEPVTDRRCLLVTSSLDAGGMDEVVAFLARRLPHHGVRTAVLHASAKGTPDGAPTGRLGRLLIEHGIETVELAGDAGARWLEAWRPDVISAHDPPSWALETATSLSIPYVDTLHGMHSLFSRDRAAEAERGRRLSGIVAVSDLVRQQYLEINPTFSPKRIVTIPNGVDDLRRTPGDREQARARWGIGDEYVFVSLARHCLQKNTYGLVAAFGDVAARHPEAHLVIAGRPDDAMYFTQVVHLRAALACRERIHLRDHTSNPAELLALADGFVLDSFFEGWSLASMEALYAGVPVVVSEVGGAREQVGADEERGHVVPNPLGDPLRVSWETIRAARYARQVNREALVVAMSSLITDRASRLAARQRLISESAARFHPDVCLRSHARVLAAAAKPNGLLHKGFLQGERP